MTSPRSVRNCGTPPWSRGSVAALVLTVLACKEDVGRPLGPDAAVDGFHTSEDAPGRDSGSTDGGRDLGADGQAVDLGILDSSVDAELDGSATADVGADVGLADTSSSVDADVDMGVDVAPDVEPDLGLDEGVDAGAIACTPENLCTHIECVPPEELQSSGLALSSGFWPGFRFEIPDGVSVDLARVGLSIAPTTTGSLFAAVVALTGPSDSPDDSNLTGSDVVTTTPIAVGPLVGSSIVFSDLEGIVLAPGWYAIVYGAGAFGATSMGGVAHAYSTVGTCTNGGGLPFTIRQSDGFVSGQVSALYFFVEVFDL